MFGGFHPGVGLAGLIQGEFAVHHRGDAAGVEQGPDVVAQLGCDLGLGGIGLRAQGRSGDRQTALGPPRKAMKTSRPSSARAETSRGI